MCLLCYKHPAIVKPSPKAFKPSRPLQVRYGLAPSGRFYLRASSLKISLPCEETNRKAVLLALVIAALCICGLSSPLPPFPFKREGSHESLSEDSPSRRQTSRHLYDVRASTSAHTPLRPLVICGTPPFAGASLYFLERIRRNLRRRFIMDIAQGLSVFPFVFLLALPVSPLIDDPR